MAGLELLPVICDESQPINLGDIVKVIQSLCHEKSELIRNVVVIIRIVLPNGQYLLLQKGRFLCSGDWQMNLLISILLV